MHAKEALCTPYPKVDATAAEPCVLYAQSSMEYSAVWSKGTLDGIYHQDIMTS